MLWIVTLVGMAGHDRASGDAAIDGIKFCLRSSDIETTHFIRIRCDRHDTSVAILRGRWRVVGKENCEAHDKGDK